MKRSDLIYEIYIQNRTDCSVNDISEIIRVAQDLGMLPPKFTIQEKHHKTMYPEYEYELFCEFCLDEDLNKWEPEDEE